MFQSSLHSLSDIELAVHSLVEFIKSLNDFKNTTENAIEVCEPKLVTKGQIFGIRSSSLKFFSFYQTFFFKLC